MGLATLAPLPARPDWKTLLAETWDLLVVGGGIHGAGAARDAALRGIRVALVERGDWASGTSSRSSKLLHGGLRYLRDGRIGLVREALAERERHLRLAPGHARRIKFRVPPTPRGVPGRWQVRLGIAAYGLLAGRPREARFWGSEPSYEDATLDDARFCLDVVLDARRHGALALTYAEATGWDGREARVRDRASGEEGLVQARACLWAAGAWASEVLPKEARLRVTRGTHVVLAGREDEDARLFFAADGRVLFLIPYAEGTTLLGTTDLDEPSRPVDPAPTQEEILYLRDAFRRQFPKWSSWRAVGLQCGLRPLLDGVGHPSKLSREERLLVDSNQRRVAILGGKYTTYRSVAERAVDAVCVVLGRRSGDRPTRRTPIPASPVSADPSVRLDRAFGDEDALCLEDALLRRTAWGHCGLVTDELLEQAGSRWALRWGRSREQAASEIAAFRERQTARLFPLGAWSS